MSVRNDSRLRRARRARARMRGQGVNRLSVHRTPRHIYAQIIAPAGDKVLASASTLDSDLRGAKAAGVDKVAFDRGGYKYHGRVKALAEAARESGLEF